MAISEGNFYFCIVHLTGLQKVETLAVSEAAGKGMVWIVC